ncbi:MAG TPA: hypothetical protein ENJ91_00600 [Rhodobacteraceae bacterium]|nr:hypothetical protein [Paracoccaceae bacterium]
MIRKGVTLAFVILAATQASALSCIRPSIENSFRQYQNAKETYILALGKLTNKHNVVPADDTPNGQGEARGESFVATFKGWQATRGGFDRPLNVTVAVRATCLSVWCGQVSAEREMLTFLEKTAFGYLLTDGPCGGTAFYDPDKDIKRRALQCLRGGVCEPQIR